MGYIRIKTIVVLDFERIHCYNNAFFIYFVRARIFEFVRALRNQRVAVRPFAGNESFVLQKNIRRMRTIRPIYRLSDSNGDRKMSIIFHRRREFGVLKRIFDFTTEET